MNSPYMGKFKVSQQYNGAQHDGLDLVGIDSKEIHSTINGKVVYSGWENINNKKQGFGQYVKIKQDGTEDFYYFGHMSEVRVNTGETVKITQVIGIEGATGNSTGSHCHYGCRIGGVIGRQKDISNISGIPNVAGGIYDDGYRPSNNIQNYTTGDYKVIATGMNVRDGAGINYRIKSLNELTQDAQRQDGYKNGVVFTALEVKNMPGESWAKTPSGWVCLYNKDGVYCQKV